MLNLKKLRLNKKISQQKFADIIGVSRSTIAMWETGGSQPDNDNLKRIANYFNVSVDYLLGREPQDTAISTRKKGIKIPVLGRVQAGIPVEAIEEILDYEEITEEMASQGEFFGLKIRGDSMLPRMVEGDVIIVRKQSNVDSGDIAVVLVNGNDATVKKIRKTESGIELVPLNPSFDIKYYSNAEIENLPITIIGKAVELRGKF